MAGNERLDPGFSKWLNQYVDQMLELHRMARPAPRTIDVWGCRNIGDFMCGFFVGEMIGAATVTFQAMLRREPSADEHMAITAIVEARAPVIRKAFLQYNRNDEPFGV